MSNYHILESSNKQNKVDVIFHIAVPNENNSVSVNLQTAVKQRQGLNETVSNVPWLQIENPTEYTAIENGEIYEIRQAVEFNANLTIVQKRNKIDARYTTLANSVPNIIRNKFEFWGLDREVI